MADQTSQSPNPAETPSSPAVASPPQQTDLIAANDEHVRGLNTSSRFSHEFISFVGQRG